MLCVCYTQFLKSECDPWLKWLGYNHVQIICSTSSAYRVQRVVSHVVRRDSSAVQLDRVEIVFISGLVLLAETITRWRMLPIKNNRKNNSNSDNNDDDNSRKTDSTTNEKKTTKKKTILQHYSWCKSLLNETKPSINKTYAVNQDQPHTQNNAATSPLPLPSIPPHLLPPSASNKQLSLSPTLSTASLA